MCVRGVGNHQKKRHDRFCHKHGTPYIAEVGCVVCAADRENRRRGYKPWEPTKDRESVGMDFRFRESVGF